ncbi:MAG: eCIS core domain-containing protein, partial [Nostoc sp.]
MHKTKSSKTDLSTYSNSPALNSFSQLAHRPYGSEIQKASVAAKTPTGIENEAFAEQQMEATGLEIQAKYDTITPEGQERLTVLQAKMDGLLNSRLSHATRFGHNIANIPLRRPHISTPIQAKLTIGEPGDKYEQEADETARQVVQRIHQPQSEKLQRESLPEEEEELQMKPERSIQQESLPAEEEELQMKPMVQRVADGGMAASPDLETSILQARGGGQSLADNIRQPMEQAFGTDFSGVKVHTGTQADQLNQSIHAKAFTTGQDVFFRQGAYEPGSQEGQKLLAHELTHVVQQGEGRAQGKQLPSDTPHSAEIEMQRQPYGKTEQREKISEENKEIQRNASVQMENKTGLPDNLKVGIENLSGLAMDDVRVHYNSPKPAELNALAYTQGSDIHVASGQEQHLPHEAWHVVQQTQGRVKPTMQMKDGVGANHEEGMEKEADVMGAKALQSLKNPYQKLGLKEVFPQSSPTVQAFGWEEIWSMAEGFGLSSVMVYTA